MRKGTAASVCLSAVAALLLGGCIGKLHIGTTHTIDATPLLPGAALTERIVIEADGAFGGSFETQGQLPSTATGWSVTDTVEGGKRRIIVSRRFTGDRIYALPNDERLTPFLGRTAVRITDYGVARRFEVRIGASPPFSTAGATDELSRSLARLMFSGFTVDHTVQLPGLVIGGNGTPADNGRMVWHLDLSAAEGRVLTAESLYVDWPRVGTLFLVVVAGTFAARRLRRDPNTTIPT